MMRLCVTNGFSAVLPGLGSNRPFRDLSESRITKAAREALRQTYGKFSVEVSCSATFNSGRWRGKCKIQGSAYDYEISG